jgi:hypothetical protein
VIRRQSKDLVTEPHTKLLEVQMLFLLLLELNGQLIHNFRLEDLSGRVPEHELYGGRHRCPEHSKLLDHLSVAAGSNLHPL